jgi:hypothetical protein
MKLEFFGQNFEKYSNTKFYENPSSGSRVVPCGLTDRRTDGQTALRNFANAPKEDDLYKTVTVLEMAGVSADCGVVEFALRFAEWRLVTKG